MYRKWMNWIIVVLVVVLGLMSIYPKAITDTNETVVEFTMEDNTTNSLTHVPLDAVTTINGVEAQENGWNLEEGRYPAVDTDGEEIIIVIEGGSWRKKAAE